MDKYKEALVFLKNKKAKITFSESLKNSILTTIEIDGAKCCCETFFEAVEKIKEKIGNGYDKKGRKK